MKTEVFIVGAGPTGLVLALWLTQNGVKCRIIDKNSGPGKESRALAVQARTLEFYRQLGIADKMLAEGILVKEMTMRRLSQPIVTLNLGALGQDLSPFPYLLFLPQDQHEVVLVDALKNVGIEIEWNKELKFFEQSNECVYATVSVGGKQEEQIESLYLAGCDGARSIVRQSLHETFVGGTYKQVFFVADAEVTGEAAMSDRLQLCIGENDFCIIMPVRQRGSYRLIGIVPEELEEKETIHFQDVEPVIKRDTGLTVQSVHWFSTYRSHHRMASHFQEGRVFLLGDAAHIHSPAGGQGMNTGIGDAVNVAWKLVEVIRGEADTALLQTYAKEREPFAKLLLSSTDKAFQLMSTRTKLGTFWRLYCFPYVFKLVTIFPQTLKLLFKLVSQIKVSYHESPLSQGKLGQLRGGDRLPWVEMDNTNNFDALKSMNWQVHVYGEVTGSLQEKIENMHLQLAVFPWHENAGRAGMTKNAVYLIRPDGYIALIHGDQETLTLTKYLPYIGIKAS